LTLWKGYVFHGEHQVLGSLYRVMKHLHPSWDSQVDDMLLEMWARGILKPIRYRPSPSRVAFGCFTGGTTKTNQPEIGNARDWEYEVIISHCP
jgi:hypothetical protein